MADARQRELKQFLAAQSPLMRKALQGAFSSFTSHELMEWTEQQNKLPALREEFERILIQVPAKWDRYRRSMKKDLHRSDPSEELRQLEEENCKLKQLVAKLEKNKRIASESVEEAAERGKLTSTPAPLL